ncbi:MAG: hypothetical protein R3E79_38105 [Caldilineaceae bacterium]
MNTKQLKELGKQLEALKSPEKSAEFHAGVDAAITVINTIVQEAVDRERMRQLEVELAELRAKYPQDGADAPKRRGRRPKAASTQEVQA